MMTVLAVFLNVVISFLQRGEFQIDLLVGVLDLLVAVVEFVVFYLQSGEFLLHSVIIIDLFLELCDLYLLSGDYRALIKDFLLNSILIILEADGLGLVAGDHLPELAPGVIVEEEQRGETLIDQLRLQVVPVELLRDEFEPEVFYQFLLVGQLRFNLPDLLILDIDLPAHSLLPLELLLVEHLDEPVVLLPQQLVVLLQQAALLGQQVQLLVLFNVRNNLRSASNYIND